MEVDRGKIGENKSVGLNVDMGHFIKVFDNMNTRNFSIIKTTRVEGCAIVCGGGFVYNIQC